nr:RecName: Full=Insertion element IS402 uncharacterized 9.6 kDa protein [Burkholderia cepacia]
MWCLEPGRARSVGFGPVFGLPQRRESMMNRRRLVRSRSGPLRAALRAVARASDPRHRLLANRAAGANMSRPSRIPSRPAGRASVVRS